MDLMFLILAKGLRYLNVLFLMFASCDMVSIIKQGARNSVPEPKPQEKKALCSLQF